MNAEQQAVAESVARNHAVALRRMGELLRWRDGLPPAPGDNPEPEMPVPLRRRSRPMTEDK